MKVGKENAKGVISSFQSMGAVDGPGVRFTAFMQGCPLRCIYCHNPETWDFGEGTEGTEADTPPKAYRVEEVMQKILRCRPYFGEKGTAGFGGVTVSGGEPLLQWEFVSELFRNLKAAGIHTALDTSGAGNAENSWKILKHTDLVLCDLKFSSEEDYRRYCGGSLEQTLSFLRLTEQRRIPLWIRHVVVPGLTDSQTSLSRIVKLARQFSNLEKIELLPFRKLCTVKYETLGIPFPLAHCRECPDERIEELYGKMEKY